MNKKLLALAVGAAFALPVAASAAPTIYGKVDVSLESIDNGTSTAVNVVDNASRLGLKGEVETSKKGLKGIYLAEFGLNADDGKVGASIAPGTSAAISQRNIYVGLAGDFGTVIAGQADTPTKSIQGKVDQFNDSSADMKNFLTGELRAPNVVAYSSPKLADAVTVHVALWQSDEHLTAGGAGSQLADGTSLAAQYQNGNLYLALGLDSELPNALQADAGAYSDVVRLVAGYNTDTTEVGFLYQTAEDATGGTGADTSMLLSGAYKTGAWKVKGQFGTTEGDISGETITAVALGADYALGKTTTVSGLFATQEYDLAAFEQTVLSIGLAQKF